MKKLLQTLAICSTLVLSSAPVLADDNSKDDGSDAKSNNNKSERRACRDLPSWSELKEALCLATTGEEDCPADPNHGGFNFHMWGTVVNRDGVVCAVAFTGGDRGDQWPGSRVISAQKANTANAFGLPGFAISTAQLWEPTRDQGSLNDLTESNPVDTKVAYRGPSKRYGKKNDPMVGRKIGGVNVFGGGLALYDEDGKLLGGLGVSGDLSCKDHIIAWIVRDDFELDNVLVGVSPTGDDNMILDTTLDSVTGHTVSAGGFGHPSCGFDDPINALPTDCPIGPEPCA